MLQSKELVVCSWLFERFYIEKIGAWDKFEYLLVEMNLRSYFLGYALVLISCLLLLMLITFINNKRRYLSTKASIIGFLAIGTSLGLSGFLGVMRLNFMPWGFVICELWYLLMGVMAVVFLVTYSKELIQYHRLFVFFALLCPLVFGIFLFQLIFNWLNPYAPGLYLASGIVIFYVPLFYWWAAQSFLWIPQGIYKVWVYPGQAHGISMDNLDFNTTLVLELELYKCPHSIEPFKVKVKAPGNMMFGHWFHKFIDDYNLKFPNDPIQYADERQVHYSWMFYIKPRMFGLTRFVDPELDIETNAINEKQTIFAKRVIKTIAIDTNGKQS